MCLIIHLKSGERVSYDFLVGNVAERNRDGYGILVPQQQGAPIVEKNPDMLGLWADYKKHEGAEMVLHLRMATHGPVCDSLTHPFELGCGYWLMHNGILDIQQISKSGSDTSAMVDMVLRPMLYHHGHDIIRTGWFSGFFETLLGSDNRAVIVGPDGFVKQYNVDLWAVGPGGVDVSNTYAWAPEKLTRAKTRKAWELPRHAVAGDREDDFDYVTQLDYSGFDWQDTSETTRSELQHYTLAELEDYCISDYVGAANALYSLLNE